MRCAAIGDELQGGGGPATASAKGVATMGSVYVRMRGRRNTPAHARRKTVGAPRSRLTLTEAFRFQLQLCGQHLRRLAIVLRIGLQAANRRRVGGNLHAGRLVTGVGSARPGVHFPRPSATGQARRPISRCTRRCFGDGRESRLPRFMIWNRGPCSLFSFF